MIYTKEKFKELWEANENGSGITFNDIADCAVAWGISSRPKTRPINLISYMVLKAANVCDAEEYNPNPASQCEKRIMIDLDKACEWLERNEVEFWNSPCNPDKIVEQFRKAMNED